MSFLLDLARTIEVYGIRRGAVLSMSVDKLHQVIVQYILMRRKTDMVTTKHTVKPAGWTSHHERLWQDWLTYHCDVDTWTTEVLEPVFGTNEEQWEAKCPGWRFEIIAFLEDWFVRDRKMMEAFDPTPEDEVEELLYGGLDPYMVENGMIKGQHKSNMSIKHSTFQKKTG